MAAVNKNKLLDNATKYIQKGQVDRAIKELQKVVEADPSDVRTRLKLGDLFAKKNQNAEAADQYNIVAESYSKDGFFLKAVAVYKQILKLDSSLIDVHLRLGDLYHQLGLLSDAMSQYQIVAQHYDSKGMSKESLATLRKMVELDPENIPSRKKLAEIIAREGNTAEAIAEFQKIAEDLKSKGRLDDLAGVLERIVHLDAANLEVVKEIAALYLDRGDPKRALAKLQTCFRANPHDLATLEMLSKAFVALGQPDKAKSVYREIAKIHDGNGNAQGKIDAFRSVLQLDPGDNEARAVVEGRPVEPSMPAYELGAESAMPAPEPSMPVAAPPMAVPARGASFQASMASVAGGPTGGSAPVAAVAADDPQTISKLLTEADVYLKYGLLEKALDHLRGIVRRNPGNVDAHLKLKDVYLQHKDIEGAVAEVVAVIELCEQSGDAARGGEALAEGLRFAPGHPLLEAKRDSGGAMPAAGGAANGGLWNANPEDGVEISIEGGQSDDLLIEDPGLDSSIEISDSNIDAGGDVEIQIDEPQVEAIDLGSDAQIEPLHPPSDESVEISDIDEVAIDSGMDAGDPLSMSMKLEPPAPRGGGEVVSLDAHRSEVSSRMQVPEFSAITPGELLHELGGGEAPGSDGLSDEIRIEAPGDLDISIEEPADTGSDIAISDDAEIDLGGDAPAPRSIEERFGATDENDIAVLAAAGKEHEPARDLSSTSGITDFSVDMSVDEVSTEIPETLGLDDKVALDEAPSKPISMPSSKPASPASTSAAAAVAAATATSEPVPPEIADDVDEADFFVKQEIYDEAIAVYKRLLKKFPGNGALTERMSRAQALMNGEPVAAPVKAPVAAPKPAPVVTKAPEPVVTRAPDPTRPPDPPKRAPEPVKPPEPVKAPPAAAEEADGGHFDLAAELMSELGDFGGEDDGPSFEENEQVSVADVLREFRKGVDKAVGTEDKQARYDLGIAYREMGLWDEAIGEFEIASADPTRRADCLNMVGLCSRDKGDLDLAIKSFTDAIKTAGVSNKQKAAFFYELAATLEQQNQTGKALQAFKQVQALDPGFRDVLEKIKKLGGGEPDGGSGGPPKKISYV